ncbi:hypothetical protein ES288_D04G026700v1 [Gossypium darwinii]|nr:hypothetical protein ES288_D04G026700v1 [Gossypium darwinii]
MRLKRSGLVTLFIGWMKLFSTVASLIPARLWIRCLSSLCCGVGIG